MLLNRNKAANKCFSLFKSQPNQQEMATDLAEKDKVKKC